MSSDDMSEPTGQTVVGVPFTQLYLLNHRPPIMSLDTYAGTPTVIVHRFQAHFAHSTILTCCSTIQTILFRVKCVRFSTNQRFYKYTREHRIGNCSGKRIWNEVIIVNKRRWNPLWTSIFRLSALFKNNIIFVLKKYFSGGSVLQAKENASARFICSFSLCTPWSYIISIVLL